ncbi:TolC family protein [Winogradskyella maritima]|uniref:TolC family protein n=1 Tax=Winogradskyella maritima TaxID=1517766 RepID=A0ABV8APB1_9FLAO|nr:TolC family protein [Winogradskyella maritima]
MKQLKFLFLVFVGTLYAQTEPLTNVLQFEEYIAYVKAYHPIVKQANLVIDESQAKLLKSRGAFDPKIDVDFDRKKFKGTEYFDRLNATFKVPTWYGIELKANFEENTGEFLNPEANVPIDGLYSAGVSVSAARDLLINDRMAALKQAKLYREQAKADRDILVNTILYEASLVYFNWLQAYRENLVFQTVLQNAQQRFEGVKRNVEVGENAAIDSIEARIAVNSRLLGVEQTRIKFLKSRLELSNYLWLENNIPLELQDDVIPQVESGASIDNAFNFETLQRDFLNLEEHPKLQSLDYKLQNLEVEERLKTNNLLPRVDLQYNFLSTTPDIARSFNTAEYKAGVNIRVPLFLRKERGDLRLAKIKVQDTEFEIDATRVNLSNQIDAIVQELESYEIQNRINGQMVDDYTLMLTAEERKFQLGESSLFLVNSRESKFIDGQLKAIELQNKFFKTKAKLFKTLAINPE